MKWLFAVAVLIGLGVVIWFAPSPGVVNQLEETHIHADFKVYLEGEAVDFSHQRFQSSDQNVVSSFVHLHDGDGEVVHFHLEGLSLGFFFETLGIVYNETCFVLDSGEAFCEDGRLFVNGVEEGQGPDYLPQDLDRLLITFGTGEVHEQLASVTDRACIYSETCPERGSPPEESSCTGAGGCLPS